MKKILVTGAAGFIGFHLCKRLLDMGRSVIGIDNLNDYYDVNLKLNRLKQIYGRVGFRFVKMDISDRDAMRALFETEAFDCVVNLAAQAGVRYSLVNPYAYIQSNINGFLNILEGCRFNGVKHLVFASSSSVYGANRDKPFSVEHNVDHPISLYAATKKSNELMAHTYASLYGIPCTGLRFFTVYGQWGRPDMALFLFTDAILNNRAIDVFNFGKMVRDFTYIDDIIEGVVRITDRVAQPDPHWSGGVSTSFAPYRLYNIGNNAPVALMRFIECIEDALGKKARKNFMAIQAGDVEETYADITDLERDVDFRPSTPIEVGIRAFVNWYTTYYQDNEMPL
ncbi:MAG: NAD-dependent epimerase [Candidatus Magnetobacterium sp. LHC-1]|uniref:NAD-dependent epimerase n=1 Tax=Candidatus Magnetobacterium casense TaxID=1455061 RepID=A0ABS6S0L6_9BACT|nr:NAD-dependent epimerase [Candidatus Magnetobacterium casensis]MBF0606917.1 NAD-dependent epimerase [Nitrospirota bacterium]MBV6341934.1 NAD-dependent epimerase [Candidatus Magnetobacterium casensis]